MKNFEKWWGEPLDPTLGDEPEFYAQEGWRTALEWIATMIVENEKFWENNAKRKTPEGKQLIPPYSVISEIYKELGEEDESV